MLKISISGVRGLVPESLTPEICLDFAKAFGTYLNDGKIVVGTDSRVSSEFIKGIVFSGLLSAGCSIIDLGICPTPTVAVMTRELQARGGLVITASHNPLPWNGLKFMGSDGIFLNSKEMEKLIHLYEHKKFKTSPSQGLISNSEATTKHIQKVLKAANASLISRRKFKVVVDACNGAGSCAAVELLKKLGCEVIELYCDPKKSFPHPPEPTPENLKSLEEEVTKKKADIGFGLDSDADRLSIVTEEGKAISEEYTLALAVKFILSKNRVSSSKKKIVVTNLSTSQIIEDLVKFFGGKLIRTKVGEVYVAQELKHLKGLIGGEGNGGVIYPKVNFNRDSLVAITLILNYLAASRRTISQLIEELPKYSMLKKKIASPNPEDLIEEIKSAFPQKTKVLTEGIKLIDNKGWVHVRPSNTEPVVRIIAEAKTKKYARQLIREIEGLRS